MNKEKIVLESVRYGALRKKEVDREKMVKDFCNMREILSYEKSKVLDSIINAIENADKIMWYENYNCGSSYAIEWKAQDEKEKVVEILGTNRLILSLFKEYLKPEIKYNYKIEKNKEITTTLSLDDTYNLFDGIAKSFQENKYSMAILEILPISYEITFDKENSTLMYKQDNGISVSFEIPKENTVILEILKKLALS